MSNHHDRGWRWCIRLGVIALMLSGVWSSSGVAASDDYMKAMGIVQFDSGIDSPDFTLMTAEGKAIRWRDLRGKVVLLNFWATW